MALNESQLTLLSRAYCSLCETMLRQAAPVASAYGLRVEVIDIDAYPDLVEQWDTLVPVLFLGAPAPDHELCHYHFDAQRTRAAIEGFRTGIQGAQIS